MADTVEIFDNYFNLQLGVNGEQYQIVYAYFAERTASDRLAGTYAETLFKISSLTGTPVEQLLAEFGDKNSMEISLTMAYYLNTFGTKDFMYGVLTPVPPNQKVQRNIVQ